VSQKSKALQTDPISGGLTRFHGKRIRAVLAANGSLGRTRSVADGDDLYAAGHDLSRQSQRVLALEDEFDLEFPDQMLKPGPYSRGVAPWKRRAQDRRVVDTNVRAEHAASGLQKCLMMNESLPPLRIGF